MLKIRRTSSVYHSL